TVRPATVGAGEAASPTEFKYAAFVSESIPRAVRWSFLLFVFTIPFEDQEFSFIPGSLTKMVGLLFFAIYILYHNTLLSKRSFPHPPKAMWWFAGYLAVYTLSGIFLPDEEMLRSYLTRLLTLLQLLLFFWIAGDLLKGKMARNALLIFAISSLIV